MWREINVDDRRHVDLFIKDRGGLGQNKIIYYVWSA